ncbi:MAG: hypothetical protein ACP5I8_13645, partial [Phycisphaerae bacterium]
KSQSGLLQPKRFWNTFQAGIEHPTDEHRYAQSDNRNYKPEEYEAHGHRRMLRIRFHRYRYPFTDFRPAKLTTSLTMKADCTPPPGRNKVYFHDKIWRKI